MKVLIISMTCGEGHNQIAKALKNALDDKKEEAKIIQLYGFSQKAVKNQNKIFLNACKYIPHLYDKIWNFLRERNLQKESKVYMNKVIKTCKDYILKEIESYSPDAIITTHNNAGAVVCELKKEGKLNENIKTYGLVFDYCLCPYWETNKSLDYVVLPHEFMKKSIMERGFNENQILPYGFPVDEKFTKKIDKLEARKELGLDADKFTVVLYSGGNCLSPAYDIIKQLLKAKTPLQIVSICGKNKKQYELVEKLILKKKLKNVLNLGFCTCLEKVFSAGDIVFSRGGGGGLTEQINIHIPFVLREKLIINEKINKQLFAEMGLGLAMNKISQAPKIVDYLYENPDKLKEMSEKSKEFCKPHSTLDFIEKVQSVHEKQKTSTSIA